MPQHTPAGVRASGQSASCSASRTSKVRRRRRLIIGGIGAGAAAGILTFSIGLTAAASIIESELQAATELVPSLKEHVSSIRPQEAKAKVEQFRTHTLKAREAADQPLWALASTIPGLGANFAAVAEVTRSADDVATLGFAPLVRVLDSLDWESLLPKSTGTNLGPLLEATPSVSSAAHAVRASSERLESIDTDTLLPQIAGPLITARTQLEDAAVALDAAASASQLLPDMLGAEVPRSYLLMIQNNAEARASGGIPGALAVLKVDNGKLTLGEQSSAGKVGIMSPAISVDSEQEQIYSSRLGKFMQDVNLTPDFPTAASTAQAMWQRKTGQRVDGVISMDPIALGYVLDATGPVELTDPELLALTSSGLPTRLTGKNVVPTLLSDVYAKIAQPEYQDVYFAGVANEVFSALATGGRGDSKGLIDGISRGTSEGRILLWSGVAEEQSVIARYPVSGSIAGPSVAPAQFGIYFNDGTGAKMDYYVKRTVRLVKNCEKDGYEQTTVRVTTTNTAPADAATSLPQYVTAGGFYGVPAGSVRTNVIAYGPVQANVETAAVDGTKTDFAAHRHANRPVGAVTITLEPGQSSTAELTFGKIVQHTEPNLVVTPTVQPVKDVILATQKAACN